MKVHFVGAGPGDPELLTLKARKAIGRADIVIYAGSLVDPRVLRYARKGAELLDSSGMTREEIEAVFSRAKAQGKTVARIHSGDPSLFSAAQEQMDWCRANTVPFEVIPGVSSFSAAAAALGQELTLPGVSQTVILSRLGGRTPVPPRESLEELARIGATLVLFLSVQEIEKVVEKLAASYPRDTPVAVVERASWPQEKIVRGTLADIAARVLEAGINRTAIIIVGQVLKGESQPSRLYDKGFSHSYREGS